MLSSLPETDHASSPVTGIVLMIGITFILAMLVLLMCLGFLMSQEDAQVPDIFKIIKVDHFDKNGKLDYNSYIVLKNMGKKSFRNGYLYVKLFVNGIQVNCNLMTLNGDAFCSSNHYGIQNIGGQGTKGNKLYSTARWYEGQDIFIDFNDGTFRPGDTICIEVYDSTTTQIISRDTYPEPKKYDTQWFYNYFLNPQAA
jgi:Archaeal Type IV pilin, N-terminal